jgi:hypothetical protein
VATSRKGTERHVIGTDSALAGILALLVEAREERMKGDKDASKVELVLSRAGLSNDDIAVVTGKQANAIRVSLMRAKSKKRAA